MSASFFLILCLMVMNHVAFKGSKVLISLFSLELGANPLVIGILFATYSFLPVLLSVYAGRISDRLGFRLPMLLGSMGLAAGLALPYFFPRLGGLFVSALLIGMFYIFFTVALQHLIGSWGAAGDRTRNYSVFSIFVGLTSLAGPMTTGFAIDGVGHRATYALLAALPLLPVVVMIVWPRIFPPHAAPAAPAASRRVTDLLRHPPLRRVLITAGILETGNELFNFLLPIYGRSIGLSASSIGLVMACYAAALLLVRAVMPLLARRSGEARVLSICMWVAAAACVHYPFVAGFGWLAATSFVLGLGLGAGAPLSMTLAYNRSPQGRSGEAIGLRQTVNKTAEVVVPVLFGAVSASVGMWPVFWLDAALLACGGWLMHGDAGRRARAPHER